MTRPDITAALVAAQEGPLLGISLRSLLDAGRVARDAGLVVQLVAVLDRPDPATWEALADAATHDLLVDEIDAADAGAARRRVTELATGTYLSVLDGGDLWSDNWLVAAHALCQVSGDRAVAHPEVTWAFDATAETFFSADQADPAFDARLLDVENPWDPACLAPLEMYADHPAGPRRSLAEADRDEWRLHRASHAAGWVHRVATDTVHFRRRTAAVLDDDNDRTPDRTGIFLQSGWAPGP